MYIRCSIIMYIGYVIFMLDVPISYLVSDIHVRHPYGVHACSDKVPNDNSESCPHLEVTRVRVS